MPAVTAWRWPWLQHVNSETRRRLYFHLSIKYFAPGLGKQETLFDGGVCCSLQVLYRFGCRKVVSNAKMEPRTYPKQAKCSSKGSQHEPRNLQRHPCGTGSKQYRKRVPKDTNPSAHFWIERVPNTFKEQSRGNMKHDVKTVPKGIPKLLMFEFVWERVTFGNWWFYTVERSSLRMRVLK